MYLQYCITIKYFFVAIEIIAMKLLPVAIWPITTTQLCCNMDLCNETKYVATTHTTTK
jgi:hypothetical protein